MEIVFLCTRPECIHVGVSQYGNDFGLRGIWIESATSDEVPPLEDLAFSKHTHERACPLPTRSHDEQVVYFHASETRRLESLYDFAQFTPAVSDRQWLTNPVRWSLTPCLQKPWPSWSLPPLASRDKSLVSL